jgi:RecA/RadA recombinase
MAGKQPLKKKEVKQKPSLASFKEKMGFSTLKSSSADKELEWIVMPKAFQDVVKLPGIPQGYVTTILGHSNTGKSTLLNHAIVSAQKQGLIPVIYDTENNFDFTYAISMGMEAEPVY